MKLRDLAVIGVWAVGTMGMVLAVGWPGMLEAVGTRGEIGQAKMQYRGCEMSVRVVSPELRQENGRMMCEAGEKVVLELVVENTTVSAVEAPWMLVMQGTGAVSPMSRVLPRPTQLWTSSGSVALQGKETKTVRLETNVAMAEGNRIMVVGSIPGEPKMSPVWMAHWAVRGGDVKGPVEPVVRRGERQ